MLVCVQFTDRQGRSQGLIFTMHCISNTPPSPPRSSLVPPFFTAPVGWWLADITVETGQSYFQFGMLQLPKHPSVSALACSRAAYRVADFLIPVYETFHINSSYASLVVLAAGDLYRLKIFLIFLMYKINRWKHCQLAWFFYSKSIARWFHWPLHRNSRLKFYMFFFTSPVI